MAANSTVGLGGFFDPATHWKIGRSDEDFGQTLGYYGCGPGFYLLFPSSDHAMAATPWAKLLTGRWT